MMDSIRISFVMDLDKNFEFFKQSLIDFFKSIINNQDETRYLETLENRIRRVENEGHTTVPASAFRAFFPPHVPLPGDIDIHLFMNTQLRFNEDQTVTPVRHLCDIVLCANPTGSLDLSEMYPILTIVSMSLNDQVEVEENVVGYRWPQGLVLIPQENIKTPSIRFGIEEIEDGVQGEISESLQSFPPYQGDGGKP